MMVPIERNETTNLPSISEGNTESIDIRRPLVPEKLDHRSSNNLQTVYDQIAVLCGPETDNDESLPPTRRAVATTFHILEQTVNAMLDSNKRFPAGFVTTDDRGGLRIEWWQERARCVTLMIDAGDESRDYVFAKLDDGKGTMNTPVLAEKLAEQLDVISQFQSGSGE